MTVLPHFVTLWLVIAQSSLETQRIRDIVVDVSDGYSPREHDCASSAELGLGSSIRPHHTPSQFEVPRDISPSSVKLHNAHLENPRGGGFWISL